MRVSQEENSENLSEAADKEEGSEEDVVQWVSLPLDEGPATDCSRRRPLIRDTR